jgi:large subunit ribosomal protein L3
MGRKLAMTSLYDDNQRHVACTLIEVLPHYVTQVKTAATDGYNAVQVSTGEKKEKRTTQALQGHFKKAGVGFKRHVREFDFDPSQYKLGDAINVDLFEKDEVVDVVGTSKGKGFQGVVKRWGFAGVGGSTHGQHNRQRHPGSIGACSFPGRVFKGMKMAGKTGNARVKVVNLRILRVIPEKNLLVVSGSVPGAPGNLVIIEK